MVIQPPTRITVNLSRDVGRALLAMSESEMRYPKQQVAWLVQREAERRGLLNKNEDTGKLAKATPVSSNAQSHKATAPLVGS